MASGVVLSVSPSRRGDTLAVATLATDTVLSVTDAGDFEEDFTEGPRFLVVGDSAPLGYVATDPDLSTVTLAAAVGAVYEAGFPVVLWDPTVQPSGAQAVEYVAQVRLDDGSGVMPATVPHTLIPAAGVDNLNGASVTVTEVDSQSWEVGSVNGREPVIDGTMIDPATLPATDGPDGLPPASSPTPTVIGGIGVLHVRWAPVDNHGPVTYEVHLSASTGFAPDASTLAAESSGGSASLRSLPVDGSALAYGTTYYVKVVAKDADGPAAASAEASGAMVQVSGPDVAADFVYANTVNANQIIGSAISADGVVATTIKTAMSGARVELDPSGLTVVDSTGSPVTELKGEGSTFRGDVTATDLTATGTVRFATADIEVGVGAAVTLADSYKAPSQAPTWYKSYDSLSVPAQDYKGLASLDATYWATVRVDTLGTSVVDKVDKSTGAATELGGFASSDARGIFVTGGFVYVVRPQETVDRLFMTKLDASTGAFVSAVTVQYNSIPGVPTIAEAQAAAYGYDATNARVLMAWRDESAGNALKISRWDTAGGNIATLTTDVTSPVDINHGIVHHATEFGVPAYAVHRDSQVRVFNASTGAQMSSSNWPSDSGVLGFTHNGSNFRALYSDHIVKYEADAGATGWWVGYEWYDSVGTTHRTGLGKAKQIYPPRRAKVTLGATTTPGTGGADDPNQARFYVARSDSGSQPAASSFWLQGAASTVGRTRETVAVPATSGTAATTTNGFPATTSPGRVVSAVVDGGGLPVTDLRGDGYARIDGTDTWHTITPLNGYTADASLTPGYRKDPIGQVTLRGRVLIGAALDGATLFTLPVGNRPTQGVTLPCVAFPFATATARVQVSTDGDVNLLKNTGAPNQFSLDGISFSTL